MLAYGVVIGAGVEVPPFTRLTLSNAANNDDDFGERVIRALSHHPREEDDEEGGRGKRRHGNIRRRRLERKSTLENGRRLGRAPRATPRGGSVTPTDQKQASSSSSSTDQKQARRPFIVVAE